MSIEIMLNAVNLLFVAFRPIIKMRKDKFLCSFLMAAAAAEVAGLALFVIFRNLGSLTIDNLKT
jgi:NADH:ubiquinone oxidoreductase subunit K